MSKTVLSVFRKNQNSEFFSNCEIFKFGDFQTWRFSNLKIFKLGEFQRRCLDNTEYCQKGAISQNF